MVTQSTTSYHTGPMATSTMSYHSGPTTTYEDRTVESSGLSPTYDSQDNLVPTGQAGADYSFSGSVRQGSSYAGRVAGATYASQAYTGGQRTYAQGQQQAYAVTGGGQQTYVAGGQQTYVAGGQQTYVAGGQQAGYVAGGQQAGYVAGGQDAGYVAGGQDAVYVAGGQQATYSTTGSQQATYSTTGSQQAYANHMSYPSNTERAYALANTERAYALSGSQHAYSGEQQVYTGQQTYAGQAYQTNTSGRYTVGAGSRLSSTTGQVIRGQERVVATNVIGHEYGAEKVISVNERVDESRTHVVNERVVESTMRVPKKIIREEIIEKVIVVPEKIIHEEIIEEDAVIQERIIEVAKPIIVEKIVEVPEIEIVEKVIEVPEVHIQERIVHVPKVEIRENIVEVPKIVTQEKIVEVPEIQYRDIPVERIVEVAEVRIEEVVKQVPVPQYVDKPIPEYVTVEVPEDVHRKLPVPVEAITTFEYKLPQFKPKYRKVRYPVYLPRFIEVPVAAEICSAEMTARIQNFSAQLHGLYSSGHAVSLCMIENLAEEIKKSDTMGIAQMQGASIQQAIAHAWENGQVHVTETGTLSIGAGFAQAYPSGYTTGATGFSTDNGYSTADYSQYAQYQTAPQYQTTTAQYQTAQYQTTPTPQYPKQAYATGSMLHQ